MLHKAKLKSFALCTAFCLFFISSTTVLAASDLDQDGLPDETDPETLIAVSQTWEAGSFVFMHLHITNSAQVTLNTDTSLPGFKGVSIQAQDLTIDNQAALSANGTGYSSDLGPGMGGLGGYAAGGAGHGGAGGSSIQGVGSGAVYELAVDPFEPGSGGGTAAFYYTPGSAGGGAVRINVSDVLLNNGVVSSDAGTATSGGGGSGGTIYVQTRSLEGSGSFRANGGGVIPGSGSGGGGGGRIAVYYSVSSFSGSGEAFGGDSINGYDGEPGTVGFFDNSNNDFYAGHNWHFQAANSPFLYRNVTLQNSSVLADDNFELTAQQVILTANASLLIKGRGTLNSEILSIEPGSLIFLDGMGYGSDDGPGKGGLQGYSGGGAGHGGVGGLSSSGDGSGAIYGAAVTPSEIGSGGGTAAFYAVPGSAGGGAVHLNVSGLLQNNGIVSANAGPATAGGGGGSGGSIFVQAGVLEGSGVFRANGGGVITGYASGGGGGGRIALHYHASTFLGSSEALGGDSVDGLDGEPGTVGFFDETTGAFTAGHRWHFQGSEGVFSSSSLRLDGTRVVIDSGVRIIARNIEALNGSSIRAIGSGVTILSSTFDLLGGSSLLGNLHLSAENLSIDSSSSISADESGYPSESGPGKGEEQLYGGGGAGHGGFGGNAYSATGGGFPYDSETEPTQWGSGGGANRYFQSPGGSGGGAIRLIVFETLRNDGVIRANAGMPGSGGGGSGGSVYATVKHLAGRGVFEANGTGGGNSQSGGGAGGRVALYYKTSDFSGTVDSRGGAGVFPGAFGTTAASDTAPNTVSEVSASAHTQQYLSETLVVATGAMTGGTVDGNLNGTLEFTSLQFVEISSGSFAGQGFFKGTWTALLDSTQYNGQINGSFFHEADGIRLKAATTGDLHGAFDGTLTETTPGSGIFNSLNSVWRIAAVSGVPTSAELALSGKLDIQVGPSYTSTALWFTQSSFKGKAVGHYAGLLDLVLTTIRVADAASPFLGEGFASASFESAAGSGAAWFYANSQTGAGTSLAGFFESPLLSPASGTLDETDTPATLALTLSRLGAGEPPEPDLQVEVLGPRNASPGQTLTYTIRYRNEGLAPADNMILMFFPPLLTSYRSGSPGIFYDPVIHTAWMRLPSVSPWEQGEITTTVVLDWGIAEGTPLDVSAAAYPKQAAFGMMRHHTPRLSASDRALAHLIAGSASYGRAVPSSLDALTHIPDSVVETISTRLNEQNAASQERGDSKAACFAENLNNALVQPSGYPSPFILITNPGASFSGESPINQTQIQEFYGDILSGMVFNNPGMVGQDHLYGGNSEAMGQEVLQDFQTYLNNQQMWAPETMGNWPYYDSVEEYQQDHAPAGHVSGNVHVSNYNSQTGLFNVSYNATITYGGNVIANVNVYATTDYNGFFDSFLGQVQQQLNQTLDNYFQNLHDQSNILQQTTVSDGLNQSAEDCECLPCSSGTDPNRQTKSAKINLSGSGSLPVGALASRKSPAFPGSGSGHYCTICQPPWETTVIKAHDPNAKSGTEGMVLPGQVLNYKIEYENVGEGIAFGVYFTDVLDADIDDTALIIGPVYDTATHAEIAPAGTYNAATRTITWIVGELGSHQGGYAEVSANLRAEALPGTGVINSATVYFPSVPEVTPTNSVAAYVPYVVTASASAGGSIDPAGAVRVPPGAEQKFVFTPAPGFHLKEIVIDGISQSGKVLGVPRTDYTFGAVNSNLAVNAVFESDDRDGDGMLDSWEELNGLSPDDPQDAAIDLDNDGLPNLDEYLNNISPRVSDSDHDGMPDGFEVLNGLAPTVDDSGADKDGDGYSNLEEYQAGTDASDPNSFPAADPQACGFCNLEDAALDSDQDGVSNCQELQEKTDPCDGGSFVERLLPQACTGPNSYFRQVNIVTVKNHLDSELAVLGQYLDRDGSVQGVVRLFLAANEKRDLIVNDLGMEENAYGTFCVYTNAKVSGAWSGGLSIYKPRLNDEHAFNAETVFDYALYYPFTNPKKGVNAVPLNTNAINNEGVLANWVRIMDAVPGDGRGISGELNFYSGKGESLGAAAVSLADGGRYDYAAHEYLGQSEIGMAEFVPANLAAKYYFESTRYHYESAFGATENFFTAFAVPIRPLTGAEITSRILTGPGEAAIVEIINGAEAASLASFSVFDAPGTETVSEKVWIPAKGSVHRIVENGALITDAAGDAVGSFGIKASGRPIAAIAVVYALGSPFKYAYAPSFEPSAGKLQFTEHNTFLGHENQLVLSNSSGAAIKGVEVSVFNCDSLVLKELTLDLGARASQTIKLTGLPVDTYGSISIKSPEVGISVLNRLLKREQYVVVLPGR